MLEPSDIRAYLALKQRVAAALADPASGFRPTRRGATEGLARVCEIGGERWTYASEAGGYGFTHPAGRVRVFIADDPARNGCCTAAELLGWLRGRTAHGRLNQFVVDNWLLRAATAGMVEPVPGVPGGWRLRA